MSDDWTVTISRSSRWLPYFIEFKYGWKKIQPTFAFTSWGARRKAIRFVKWYTKKGW